jgi:hypothetical protein
MKKAASLTKYLSICARMDQKALADQEKIAGA